MKIIRNVYLFCTLAACLPAISQAGQFNVLNQMRLNAWELIKNRPGTAFAATAGVIGGTAALYYLFKKLQLSQRLENTIIDATADAIYISLLPHSELSKLPDQERHRILRQKAHFINIRKRALKKLEQKINSNMALYSEAHLLALGKMIVVAKVIFKIIDRLRVDNPHEQEFATPSYLDQKVEDRIVNSFILSAKPENELSPEEAKERAAMKEKRALVLEKLQTKMTAVPAFILNKIKKNSYILDFFE